ncbi:MAG: hypothetical protein ACOYI3_00575 [Christensenellales bacterium]|jgi:glycopeptide antibiotics resistance protein
MFENLYLNAAVFAVGGFIIAFAAALALKARKGGNNASLLSTAAFFGLFAGGLAYVVALTRGAESVFIPFIQWTRVREIGYTAVWMHFARTVLPFVPAGFLLPKFAKKCSKLRRAALFALGAAAVTALFTAVFYGFNADCTVGAFLGMLIGFGLFSFIKLFFANVKFFKEPQMSRKTHIAALSVVLAVYMACVALIVVDSGGEFEKLNIFTPDNPLPAEMTVEITLGTERSSAMTYKTVSVDAAKGAEKVAAAFGLTGTAQPVDGNDISRRAIVAEGFKSVNYYITGEWKYLNEGFVAAGEGALLPLTEYERLALELTQNGSLPFEKYTVEDVSTGKKKDANGNLANTVSVYLLANGAEGTVQGSCEVEIVFWYDGTVYSVSKYNADFEAYKSVSILSAQEAWDLALSGGGAHTLWTKAKSATIHSAELAYWLEEIKGYLQPIWMFTGTAVTEDGDTAEFQVFVPAMVY